MGKIWKPGDPQNGPETGTPILKPGLSPRPQMTARVAGKVTEMVKAHLDSSWNPDEYIDSLRADYDFKIKVAKPMCDPGMRAKCAKCGNVPWCGWRDYLECNMKTLEWRKKELVANKGTLGGQVQDIEIESVHHVIDLSIATIQRYIQKQGSSLK